MQKQLVIAIIVIVVIIVLIVALANIKPSNASRWSDAQKAQVRSLLTTGNDPNVCESGGSVDSKYLNIVDKCIIPHVVYEMTFDQFIASGHQNPPSPQVIGILSQCCVDVNDPGSCIDADKTCIHPVTKEKCKGTWVPGDQCKFIPGSCAIYGKCAYPTGQDDCTKSGGKWKVGNTC